MSTRARAGDRSSYVGRALTVDVGAVAHGGHCVARYEGRVVFVRHSLPGERVVAEVTEGGAGSRFLRADAVEVVEASPDRVAAPCPVAGPGGCGGCDFQHVALPAQRELKSAVVREQMQRLAGLDVTPQVEAVPGDRDGLGWRTRVRYAVDARGRAGLRRYRSRDVQPADRCLIAHPDLPDVLDRPWPAAGSVAAVVSSAGERLRVVSEEDGTTRRDGPARLHERAGGRDFVVTGTGFWQVHPGAAGVLVEAVLEGLRPRAGERAVDLYAGVGLFAAALADAVAPTGTVLAVESDAAAVGDAAENLAGHPPVEVVRDRVERAARHDRLGKRADLVVLDPPRSGAGRVVVDQVAALRPRAVAYVACDPATLARDVALLAGHGYRLTTLRGFDIFPMTHHVECVALLAGSETA